MTRRKEPVPMESQDGDLTNERINAEIRARIEELGERGLVERLLDQGQSVVYMDGRDLVREHPDGTREVVGHLDDDAADEHDA